MTDVVLVDEHDRPVGVLEKHAAHRSPAQLHRAFSAFLFDGSGALLLQRRAASKYHFPLLWANTCCGHPLPGESVLDAAARRARDELGLVMHDAQIVGAVTYQAHDPRTGLAEYEYDHVVVGRFAMPPMLNDDEVDAVELVDVADLAVDLARRPDRYAPWLAHVLPVALQAMPDR